MGSCAKRMITCHKHEERQKGYTHSSLEIGGGQRRNGEQERPWDTWGALEGSGLWCWGGGSGLTLSRSRAATGLWHHCQRWHQTGGCSEGSYDFIVWNAAKQLHGFWWITTDCSAWTNGNSAAQCSNGNLWIPTFPDLPPNQQIQNATNSD